MEAHHYPRIMPRSTACLVRVNGVEVDVLQSSCGPFVTAGCAGPSTVEITLPHAPRSVSAAPRRLGIVPDVEGTRVRLSLPGPAHIWIDIDGQPVFVFIDAPDPNPPSPTDPNVRYFARGQVHEVGELRLESDQTAYLEPGAVVRGCIRATHATNVRIAGLGILDGGYYARGIDSHRSILLEGCRDATIEGITMIEPTTWMLVLGACDGVTVRGIKQLGECAGSDGVDIVGSRRVQVLDSFLRNGDDCIAIKSLDLSGHDKTVRLDHTRNVEDALVAGCAFMCFRGGCVMELGHEIRCDLVRNVTFRDCDVLAIHQYGSAFAIHQADHATIEDVLWENIRVEHHYDKLIDLRIVHSRWGRDAERGRARHITFRNCTVTRSVYNAGYSVSLISGHDAAHLIEQVRFENFLIDGQRATGPDDLDLYLRHTRDITFA